MNRITSTITYGNNVRTNDDDDWRRRANPWTVQLRYKGRKYTFPFWTGSLASEPSTFDALYCVLSDASGYDSADGFEDWASNYGYDTDSRKAEAIYSAVAKECSNVRRLLGDDWDEFIRLDEDDITTRCK